MSRFNGQIAVFRLADRRYGIPVLLVEEFFRPVPITPVPGADRRIAGLINLRGASATVVDLRIAIGLPARAPGEASRMLMLETAEKLSPDARAAGIQAPEDPVALLVDRVDHIATVRDQPFHPPPAHTEHRFATGVFEMDDGYITLLSVQDIFDDILAQPPASGTATP